MKEHKNKVESLHDIIVELENSGVTYLAELAERLRNVIRRHRTTLPDGTQMMRFPQRDDVRYVGKRVYSADEQRNGGRPPVTTYEICVKRNDPAVTGRATVAEVRIGERTVFFVCTLECSHKRIEHLAMAALRKFVGRTIVDTRHGRNQRRKHSAMAALRKFIIKQGLEAGDAK